MTEPTMKDRRPYAAFRGDVFAVLCLDALSSAFANGSKTFATGSLFWFGSSCVKDQSARRDRVRPGSCRFSGKLATVSSMRCARRCPVGALSIWNPVGGIVRAMLPGLWGWGAGVLAYAATVVGALLLLDVATRRAASSVPLFRTMLGLLTWGHTSLYGRYTAEPFRGNDAGDGSPNDVARGDGTQGGSL